MGDNWDDSDDDDWDVDDDALDAKLGLNKKDEPANNFDDEEDLALKEKEDQERLNNISLKKKGSALAAKKQAEKDRADDLEIARKALELEAEMESKMTIEERKLMQRKREADADDDGGDAFGGGINDGAVGRQGAQQAGDKVIMKDMKDHMKHARKVADAMNSHGKIHLAAIFIKEVLQQSRDVLDDAAITDIIKTCNVIKNEKVQQAKRKVKGQAQKSKKQDKIEKAKAKKMQDELFGDSNQYDEYDEYGASYEDDFF